MKDRIRQLMEAQHMNQQAFARFTKIGTASLSSIFTGRTRPTMNHVVAIMDAFPKVNPSWLIKGEGTMMLDGSLDVPTETTRPAEKKEAARVEGNLFTENSFQETSKPEPAATKAVLGRSAIARKAVSEVNVATDNMAAANHHITEIRVFFDDQTWESFVPKK